MGTAAVLSTDIAVLRVLSSYLCESALCHEFKVWSPHLGLYLPVPCLGGISSIGPSSEISYMMST